MRCVGRKEVKRLVDFDLEGLSPISEGRVEPYLGLRSKGRGGPEWHIRSHLLSDRFLLVLLEFWPKNSELLVYSSIVPF
jgi:hypothetical protein